MNKRLWTIILAIVLVGCFFLPVTNMVNTSWYDMVFRFPGGGWQKYIPVLIPLSGVMLLIGALNDGNYFLGRGLWAWLPLLAILYIIIVNPLINGMAIGDVFKAIGKGYGTGMWVAIAASLVTAFYNPRK